MKKSFFAVGAAALIFMLAACNQPNDPGSVSLEPNRPGQPSSVTLIPSSDGYRAIVRWTAGVNAVNHQIVKRMGDHNPIPVEAVEMKQGGVFSWQGNLHTWAYGNNTDQWSAVITLFTDWEGVFEVGVRAVPFDFVLGTWTPSAIEWGGTAEFSSFIDVERIDWKEDSLPPSAPLDLNTIAEAYPDNATKRAITWKIWAGEVGAETLNQRPGAVEWLTLPDGILPYAGTFTIRGIVADGIDKGRNDFIDAAHVVVVAGTDRYDPVNALVTETGDVSRLLPDTVSAGDEFDLNALAQPSIARSATNQDIEWYYALPGNETWIPIDNGQFIVPAPEPTARFTTISLRAIIPSGRLWLDDIDANVYIFGPATRISDPFVPVTSVSLLPEATFDQNANHNLRQMAFVSPQNATHTDIVWEVQNHHVDQWGIQTPWSEWHPIPDASKWVPTTFGDHRLRATIVRGIEDSDYKMANVDYTRIIPIVVRPVAAASIIPVTSVTLAPRIVATGPAQINLNNHITINPSNATNREIIWDDVGVWMLVDNDEQFDKLTNERGVIDLAPVLPPGATATRLIVAGEIPDGVDRDNPYSFLEIIYIEPVAFVPVESLTVTQTTPSPSRNIYSVYDLNSIMAVSVTPSNATNRAITWEYRHTGMGASIEWTEINGGLWNPTVAARFEVRARIRNGHTVGLDFVSRPILFNAEATAPFVPATSISFVTGGQSATVGQVIDLLNTTPVGPANATVQTIQWTVVVHTRDIGRGETSRTIPMTLADNASTLTLELPVRLYPWERMHRVELTATIVNGAGTGTTDFSQPHTIDIFAP